MSRILVTGHKGSLGSLLVKRLKEQGHEVVVITSGKRVQEPHFFDEIDSAETIDYCYHLAASIFVPRSWEKPDEFIEANVLGMAKVLEFCREHAISLIHVSSYVYGTPNYLPIDEKHELSVANPYALSKKMAEELVEFYGENFGLKYNIIRPFNVFGAAQKKELLLQEIFYQIQHADRIEVQSLTPRRDYIYIDDVIDFFVLAKEKIVNEAFNVGSGKSYSVKELIDICQKVFGTNLPVEAKGIERKNEIPDTVADMSKAKKVFGWEHKFSLEEGIEHIKLAGEK